MLGLISIPGSTRCVGRTENNWNRWERRKSVEPEWIICGTKLRIARGNESLFGREACIRKAVSFQGTRRIIHDDLLARFDLSPSIFD